MAAGLGVAQPGHPRDRGWSAVVAILVVVGLLASGETVETTTLERLLFEAT